MNDTITSLIRTYVPLAVGALVAWLVTLGIEVSTEAQTGLIVALTSIITAVYYTIVRALEKKFPWIGVLLGTPKQPEYPKEVTSKSV